ncbi:hypothetical protein JOE44_001077 [Chryseobacterium sp. PvR013]|nr:hypothetical protein [Chryseobacterium sp. PvR013]
MCKIFIVDENIFLGEILEYHLQLNPDYEVLPNNSTKLHFKPLQRS